jgi:hypothetical protein
MQETYSTIPLSEMNANRTQKRETAQTAVSASRGG